MTRFFPGIHAREWVAPAAAVHIIHQLTLNLSAADDDLVKYFDWFVMPVFNVDGYKYSWEKDRMWRKNRYFLGSRNLSFRTIF